MSRFTFRILQVHRACIDTTLDEGDVRHNIYAFSTSRTVVESLSTRSSTIDNFCVKLYRDKSISIIRFNREGCIASLPYVNTKVHLDIYVDITHENLSLNLSLTLPVSHP
jgi:hypothetical protein